MLAVPREADYYSRFRRLFDSVYTSQLTPFPWGDYASAIAERHDPGFGGPDFLSISPARSATTWLFEQLSRHSSIHLPKVKETNYFLDGWMDGPYGRFFEDRRPGLVAGDISPSYAVLPRRAIQAIRSTYPKLRLICILRNPIDRLWSHLLFDAVRKQGSLRMTRTELAALPEQVLLALTAYGAWMGRPEALLEAWLESFPPDQFHVEFFDSICSSPEAVFGRICRFLQVPDGGFPLSGKVNAFNYGSITMPPGVNAFLRTLYRPQLEDLDRLLKSRFGFGIPPSWHIPKPAGPEIFKVIEYGGWDIYFSEGRFHRVPKGDLHLNGNASAQIFGVLPAAPSNREVMLEKHLAWICAHRTPGDDPIVVASHKDHNLVAFRQKIYAVPQALGVWDKWETVDPESVPGILAGPSLDAVMALLDD